MTRCIRLWTVAIGLSAAIGLSVGICPALGQQSEPWRGSVGQKRPAAERRQAPTQPMPTLHQQPAPVHTTPKSKPPVRPPFVLTPDQQAEVDMILKAWEKSSSRIKTFECGFTRWEYDLVFGPTDKPKYEDHGRIKYATPDKGLFQVDGPRAEHWVSNGRSIFSFDYQRKLLTEHKLPPELRGKAISDGPLPFLFGAKAEKLRQRYLIRIITPKGRQGEVWLEAYPRFQADAANYKSVELILTTKDMLPSAMQIHLPNGKTRTAYQFHGIVVNSKSWLRVLEGDPFNPRTPTTWRKVVEEPRTAQASRQKRASGKR